MDRALSRRRCSALHGDGTKRRGDQRSEETRRIVPEFSFVIDDDVVTAIDDRPEIGLRPDLSEDIAKRRDRRKLPACSDDRKQSLPP